MKLKFHKLDDLWREYRDERHFIQVKVYDKPSRFGINHGRVSKLWAMRDGRPVISYDRGWDIQPTTAEDGNLLTHILCCFE